MTTLTRHLHNPTTFLARYGHIQMKTGWIPYPDAYGADKPLLQTIDTFVRSYMNRVRESLDFSWTSNKVQIAFDGSFFIQQYADLLKEDFKAPAIFANVCGGDNKRPFKGTAQLSIGPRGKI
jgi:hypothetical protein